MNINDLTCSQLLGPIKCVGGNFVGGQALVKTRNDTRSRPSEPQYRKTDPP